MLPLSLSFCLKIIKSKKENRKIKIGSMQLRANGRFLAEHGNEKGICKVIIDAYTNVLLGVTLLGGVNSEMIYGAAAMIEAEFRVKDIKDIIFPHPTVSELIPWIFADLKKILPESV